MDSRAPAARLTSGCHNDQAHLLRSHTPVSQTKFCLLPQLPRTFKKKNPNNLNYASPLTSTLSPTQIAFPSFDLERLK
ncbi:hypothetical protein L914_20648 [Phytophthora nicotianae]|uniref:Uncharacterized protein n=1 Tax=Phytophthora nicotianae TaxID=4792 RepID=W2M654_PHYNI|nr:hypothetical protein L914_20648 [Phytophthora nicotianae]